MKTNKINSLSFESKTPKQRYITDSMRASIESLLLRMNGETKVEERGDYFISTITNKLKNAEGPVFEDERKLKKSVPYNEQMQGFSVLKFGNTRFDIDNKTGEIIDYKKPFYKTWYFVLKKAEEVLQDFRVFFNDTEIIQKEHIQLNDLTPDGAKRIKKMVLKFEKKRLEEITNNLKELENDSK